MKPRIKSMIWNIRKKKNIQSEQQEEKRIPPTKKYRSKNKNKDRLRSLWDNFKCTNTQIVEVLEGEEKEQEIENLLEKIMKETSLLW